MNLDLSKEIGVEVQAGAPLSKYTTFQLGGPCRQLINCRTAEQLEHAVKRLIAHNIPFLLIGGGSNLVVSDAGIDCAVIRFVSDQPIIQRDGTDVTVTASTLLDHLALYCAQQGLAGLNYTSGIPGTVGGAIVGNAGAFGKQVGDVLKSVVLLSPSGELREVGPEALHFRYRHSILKETGDIVVKAAFAMTPASRDPLLKERDEYLAIRHEKHPDLRAYPCAGSFFRNIEPTSKAGRRQAAGWFLEQAGGKELSSGGAAIFSKHANIIVKSENCTAQDVYRLSQRMKEIVQNAFGLTLEREVRFVGKISGTDEDQGRLVW
ncbi:MAG: UDP-N-acetylmuramate dehydrogenase [Candidatus Omnitrophota bacterium]|nr:UDP-N-acetylmuramate dehydrogenase [Candidatus Omnitrophota bacterium]MDZ4241763.1 UDP-N-acetylmuramate dehydrogenase [Candidatus Omnitrophota bacterium]